MTDDDMPKFAKLWTQLSRQYRQHIDIQQLNAVWECLKSLSCEEVYRVSIQHLNDPKHGSFMPTIADFKRMLSQSDDARALQAWDTVCYSK